MNNWGIREHIIALALLPVLVVATVLTSYFTFTQLSFITESQTLHGNIITRQLAPASEYAIFSGNINSLKPILENTLLDNNITNIKITDENHNVLISINNDKLPQKSKTIWQKIALEERTTFRQIVNSQSIDINLPEINDNSHKTIIGHIEVTLSSININAKKIQTIAKGSLITLFILFASMVLAIRLSKKISQPVQILTSTVKKISSGDYTIRIDEQASGDLGTLQSCLNIMASELQHSRDDLKAKIDESTMELQETMEELEIRNAELDIARSNAIQASKAKTEFLANMSHELRTPLGGILGFSELLENSELDSQQRDYSEIIKKSANNLLHIIDDVLDLSKIESGKIEINFTEFNIIDIVEEVIDLLIPIAYEKNIELFYYIENETPCIINSDPIRIRQILINLIGNAIKFTDEGSVSLHISSSSNSELTTNILFQVSDTGIGMNQIQQERLFNAFTQADKSIERKFGGTGLGLVISKKLARLIQGDIYFESQYNKGSCFTLEISAKARYLAIEKPPSLSDKHICFIEPHCECKKGIQSILNKWDLNITQQANCPDDISNYDLIIISICRTGMQEDKIKPLLPSDNKKNIPVLAIVSTRSHKVLMDIKNYGFDDAVFRSSKQSYIQQSIFRLLNHDIARIEKNKPVQETFFDWSQLNILVVDDNDINLKLAEIILNKNGANVTTAISGADAIDKTNKHHYDLIFMDLQMPEMDGYECSRQIRQNIKNSNSIIIALTANAMATKDLNRFEQCGINDVLIKPFNETCIQNMINQWLLKNNTRQPLKTINRKVAFFSKSEALELAAGNIKLANELTNMLLSELPSHLQIISDALSENNIELLRQQTHKLHGATRCCGTVALRNAAEQLESDIDNDILEKLKDSSDQLIAEIERLIRSNYADLEIHEEDNKN